MKPSKFQLNELLSYLPAFETSGREFGKSHESEQQKDGSYILGWNEYDPDVIRFF